MCPERQRYRYDEDFYRYLVEIVADLDKKIRRHTQRLETTDDVRYFYC